jgi:hypothetical protein
VGLLAVVVEQMLLDKPHQIVDRLVRVVLEVQVLLRE